MNVRSKGIALSYVYTGLNTVIGLFMSAYIIRMMGNTEYGIYQTMTSFATYLSLFEFGSGTIMARNVALCKKNGCENSTLVSHISTVWMSVIIQSILILGVSILFYMSIGTIYNNSLTETQIEYGKLLFVIIIIKLILSFYIQALNGIVLGFEAYSFSTIVSIVYLLVRTGIVVSILFLQPYALTLVIIDTLLTILMFLYTVLYCITKLKISFSLRFFDVGIFKNIFPLAIALFLQSIINMANSNVDKFVIGVLMSPEAVTVYSVGMYIYMTFSSLTTIPISLYMPKIAGDIVEGKKADELTETLIQPCRLIFLIGGLVLFGYCGIGKQFITIVYGEKYLEAWIIAIVVMLPMLINMSNGVLVNVLDILNKRLTRSLCLLFTTIANIILTVWWIKTWGMIGAAVATAICTLVGQVLIMNIYYAKVIKIKIIYLFKKTFQGILECLILALGTSIVVGHFIVNVYVSFILGGVAFVIVFAASMLLFGLNEHERGILQRVMRRNEYKN